MSAVIGKAVAHTQLQLCCSPSISAAIKVALISPSRESAVLPQEKQLRMRGEIERALTETPVTGQGRKLAAQNWHSLSMMEQTHRRPPCSQKE